MKAKKIIATTLSLAMMLSVMPSYGAMKSVKAVDNSNTPKYSPIENGLEINNGQNLNARYFYNRPLYGGYHGNDTGSTLKHVFVYAADRPSFMYIQRAKLANVFFGIKDGKWLHDMENITAKYISGHEEYEITDSSFEGTIKVVFVRSTHFDGLLVKVSLPDSLKDKLVVAAGGTSDNGGDYNSAILGKMNFVPSSCSGTTVESYENSFSVIKTGDKNLNKFYGISNVDMTFEKKDATKFTSGVSAVLGSGSTSTPMAVGTTSGNTENDIYLTFTTENKDDAKVTEYMSNAAAGFEESIQSVKDLSETVKIETPDEYLDTTLMTQVMALDSAIDYPYIMHGGTRWHIPFSGWRYMYAFSVLGDKDKENDPWNRALIENAKVYIDLQKQSSIAGRIPSIPTNSLGGNNRYNMGEVFVDQLLYYYENSNDIEFMRDYGYDCIKAHLAFIEEWIAVDGTNLYENYLNAWNTDNKWTNGGPSTIATTYAWRAYNTMAKIAEDLGKTEDVEVFRKKADAIKAEFKDTLWSEDKGVFAEYKDIFGNKLLHDAPDLSSIYTPIDLGLTDDFEAYQNLKYSENYIERIPAQLGGELVYTSNWLPSYYSTYGIYPDEMTNLALSYFQNGQTEEGMKVMKGLETVLFNNHGDISTGTDNNFSASGNLDFPDITSIFIKSITDGIFGITVNAPDNKVTIKPAFPKEWNNAKIETPNLSYSYKFENNAETFNVTNSKDYVCNFKVPVKTTNVSGVTVNGKAVDYDIAEGVGGAYVTFNAENADVAAPEVELSTTELKPNETVKATFNVDTNAVGDAECYFALYKNDVLQKVDMADASKDSTKTELEITLPEDVTGCELKTFIWDGQMKPVSAENNGSLNAVISYNDGAIPVLSYDSEIENGGILNISSSEGTITEIKDMQGVVQSSNVNNTANASVNVNDNDGYHTIFAKVNVNNIDMWLPVDFKIKEKAEIVKDNQNSDLYASTINLDDYVNQDLKNLHKNSYSYEGKETTDYIVKRFPWSSDSTRTVGINGRSWWNKAVFGESQVTVDGISGLPEESAVINSAANVPFRISNVDSKNAVFTSLYGNFPDKITIPVNKTGQKMYFMLAVSTNNMQSHVENARITVNFKDGTNKVLSLSNPENIDDWLSYGVSPYAQSGIIQPLGGLNGKAHANILELKFEDEKEVESFTYECIANEVLAGLLGATIYSFGDAEMLAEAEALVADSQTAESFYDQDKLQVLKDKKAVLETLKSGEYTDAEFVQAVKDLEQAIDEYKNSSTVSITFTPEDDTILQGTEVLIESNNPGVVIRYTTDGSEPTKDSPEYTGPISLVSATTIKAAPFYNDVVVGATAVKVYSIAGINLAVNKNAEASNYYKNQEQYSGAMAVDGSTGTRWATDNGLDSVSLTIDLGSEVSFNKVVLNEALFADTTRLGNLEVQYLGDDGAWKQVYSSSGNEKTTVTGSADPKQSVRELIFPTVKSSKVKVIIGTVGDTKPGPSLFECEVYNDLGNIIIPKLEIGSYITMGQENGTPITWRIVDQEGENYVLTTDKMLSTKMKFDEDGSNYWPESDICSWLNDTFYNEYFTADEQKLIAEKEHKNIITAGYKDKAKGGSSEYQWSSVNISKAYNVTSYNDAYYVTGTEKIFLPDIKQLYDMQVTNKDALGENYATPKDSNGVYQYAWTRTPMANNDHIASTTQMLLTKNVVDNLGNGTANAGNFGVRPMMYLVENVTIADGIGTEGDPFTITLAE